MDGIAAPLAELDDTLPSSAAQDPRVAGLERKLDVLRAQLDAARDGRDPEAAGPETWSRLEQQAQRIAELESALGRTRRERLMLEVELTRARDEVIASQRGQRQLGAMLVELSRREIIAVRTAPAPEPPAQVACDAPGETAEAALLRAVLASTSWRVTQPLRAVAHMLKGRRGPMA